MQKSNTSESVGVEYDPTDVLEDVEEALELTEEAAEKAASEIDKLVGINVKIALVTYDVCMDNGYSASHCYDLAVEAGRLAAEQDAAAEAAE